MLLIFRQLASNKAMFQQYKESMRNDMLNEISLAKKAALMKIVDSGTVTKGSQPSSFVRARLGSLVLKLYFLFYSLLIFFGLFLDCFGLFWIVFGSVALESGVICGSSLFFVLGFGFFERIAPTCHQDRGGGG